VKNKIRFFNAKKNFTIVEVMTDTETETRLECTDYGICVRFLRPDVLTVLIRKRETETGPFSEFFAESFIP